LLDLKLTALPKTQRSFWRELEQTPRTFVLYGGTAMALRLGHRQSEDFDFFCDNPFQPSSLLAQLPYLKSGRVDQRGDSTLTVVVDRNGPIKLSFFGDVRMGRINDPDVAPDNRLQIASLLDLTATKLKTIQQRAEAKDYLDVAAALRAGINLAEGLGAARAVYGAIFNAIATLKALTYFEDGNLRALPSEVKRFLVAAAERVTFESIPLLESKPGICI
jgi:Nucleotidyl transferase AbiEii toxin, Type IV TA system